jgi:NADPH2:quinone reductase
MLRGMPRAIRIYENGGPEVMRLEEVDPGKPAPGEVQIRHTAIGVNYIDVYDRTGLYPVSLPSGLGREAAGVITALGRGVRGLRVGERVAYVFPSPGAYCEVRNVPAERVVRVPRGISDEQAAALMLKGLTAQFLIRRSYKVARGDPILVHAAAGGVGLILCQWGHHLGATVIGTVGSKDKAALAKANGADHTILYREENFAARVKDITGGKLCHVVYDGVGKETFPASLDCIRPLGMFASFGSASGPIEAFNIGILAQKGSLFATRPTLNTYTATREDLLATANDLFAVVSSGAVKIPVNQKYPLKDAQKAHRDLEGRATTGSSILIP